MPMDPAVTNAFVAEGPGGAQGEREDLSDVITRIDPDEVPFYSNGDKGGCDAIISDWLVQELGAVDPANKQPEGYEATYDPVTPTVRFNNVCQILARTAAVSKTMDVVSKAGRGREVAYQKVLKGLEIRRDLNAIITLNAAKDTTDPRGLAGIPAWITNGSAGATAGAMPTGDGSDGYTPGDARAMDLDPIDDGMQQAYEDGGQPEIMYMTPGLKRAFSKIPDGTTLVGNELQMTRARDAVFVGSVSVYLTDFGILEVAVDRFMSVTAANKHSILGMDPNHYECCTLPQSNFSSENYAKTGASFKFGVDWEGMLQVTAPKAHFAVHDIDPALPPT